MNNFRVRRANNKDPITLNHIRAGNLYFALPTNARNIYVPLTQASFNTLVKSHHGPNTPSITPWGLFNLPANTILFRHPTTRRNVKVGNIQIFRQPHYGVTLNGKRVHATTRYN